MRLCIDGSNLHSGGSKTHLHELLARADPASHGFDQVVVWASQAVLANLDDRPWLIKRSEPVLERNFLRRALWQRFSLGRRAQQDGCDLLFVPGGSFATSFRPVVAMSRNMLPYEFNELRRYGLGATALKFLLLRWGLNRSFRRAQGVIFLTRYAHDAIVGIIGTPGGQVATIPHGIDRRFSLEPRPQIPASAFSAERPFRLVYVSTVDVYKHQDRVAEAVAALRSEHRAVTLDLIGPAYPPSLDRLKQTLARVDPDGQAIRYLGPVPHARLHASYAAADAAVFASSCENMPNILLEKMAAGLPIACARRGPMPDILGDGGLYFDPESTTSITDSLRQLMDSHALRARLADVAKQRAEPFSWERCTNETFAFLAAVAQHRAQPSGGPQLA